MDTTTTTLESSDVKHLLQIIIEHTTGQIIFIYTLESILHPSQQIQWWIFKSASNSRAQFWWHSNYTNNIIWYINRNIRKDNRVCENVCYSEAKINLDIARLYCEMFEKKVFICYLKLFFVFVSLLNTSLPAW